jgi:hypothetical protein
MTPNISKLVEAETAQALRFLNGQAGVVDLVLDADGEVAARVPRTLSNWLEWHEVKDDFPNSRADGQYIGIGHEDGAVLVEIGRVQK